MKKLSQKASNLSWRKARAELTSRPDWVRYVWTSSTNWAPGIPLLSATTPGEDEEEEGEAISSQTQLCLPDRLTFSYLDLLVATVKLKRLYGAREKGFDHEGKGESNDKHWRVVFVVSGFELGTFNSLKSPNLMVRNLGLVGCWTLLSIWDLG